MDRSQLDTLINCNITKQDGIDFINSTETFIRRHQMHYAQLLKNIFEMSGYESYLELGIWTGTVINEIPAKRKVGVDIEDRRTNKDYEFFLGTTDQYFAQLPEETKFDMIFIDAQHTFEAVKKDLENSMAHLTDNGLIIIDDTDPGDLQFYADCADVYKIRKCLIGPCGDCSYIDNCKLILDDDFEAITLPIHTGMTLVKKSYSRRQDVV